MAARLGISELQGSNRILYNLTANGVVAFIKVRWQTTDQHVLPYTGSADGLETWVDIDLGRNDWRVRGLYDAITGVASGRAYYINLYGGV